ncbi:MAG TPA: SOS response-associated peptidase [Pyrinomonadaceae bacterium]|nr:SOS response-associated peptidase [Pyrinomonadaceae bacterium]
MCGRFANNAKKKDIEKEFKIGKLNKVSFDARYNIAPSQMIDAVLESDAERILTQLKWGLIPRWAKDDSFASKTINARAETLSEKASFRDAFKSRRCIIPASGFYEWAKKGERAKQPFYFYLTDKDVFGFAGLYEEWLDKESGELIETCTIITTEANEVLEPVHDRMPVILKVADYDQWLDEKEKNTDRLQNLLVPFPAEEMASHAVSKAINSPSYDSPELIINSK